MGKLLAVGFTDLRIFLSSRANLVGLLLIPLIMTTALGFINNQGLPYVDIAIVDDDQSALSGEFIAELEAINERYRIHLLENGIEDARQRVVDGQYEAAVIIPEGFADAIENFEEFELNFYSNEELSQPSALQPTIQAIIGRFNGSIVAARVGSSIAESIGADVEASAIYDTANAILAQEPVQFDFQQTAVENRGERSGFNQSVPGMGSMFVLFTVLGGMAVLIRERQQWTIQRLIVMPVSRAQIIGGKIFAYFTLGMIQYAVVFALGLAFGVNFGENGYAVILIAMAFVLAATSLTFTMATFLRSEGQASQLTTMLSLALAALGGAWWPLDIVPEFMQIAGHLSPIAWAMDGFQKIIWYDRGLIDVLPEIGVLLGIAAVLFLIGIANFKYE